MKIVLSFFDKSDRTIKKTLFAGWKGRQPLLVAYPDSAKDYVSEVEAQSDMNLLSKGISEKAITLSIKLEEL